MDANIKIFNDKYCMHERHVYATWRGMCEKMKILSEDAYR